MMHVREKWKIWRGKAFYIQLEMISKPKAINYFCTLFYLADYMALSASFSLSFRFKQQKNFTVSKIIEMEFSSSMELHFDFFFNLYVILLSFFCFFLCFLFFSWTSSHCWICRVFLLKTQWNKSRVNIYWLLSVSIMTKTM